MTFVLDSQAVLAYFQGEPAAPAVRDLLLSIQTRRERGLCSVVNLAEIEYIVRRRAPDQVDSLVQWLLHLGVEAASADAVWREAAAIKAEHAVALPDAFALATAIAHDATLVTCGDPDFDVAPRLGVKLLRV